MNVLTGQRSPEFPVLSGQIPRDKIYRRGNGWTDQARTFKAFYELTTLRQSVGELPASNLLRRQWRSMRGRALARRPRTMLEVMYACEVMGIDPLESPQLVFLAEMALCLELPLGWEQVEHGSSGTRFFRNNLLRLSQWQHPALTYLVALMRSYTAADAEAASVGDGAADDPPNSGHE